MIEFIHVNKSYNNQKLALNDLNFKIEKGEFVAIIGPSGAGKSTLLRCVNRMHGISSGQVIVDGIDVSKLSGKDLRDFRQKVGMIFQSFNLVTRMSVLRNVLLVKVPQLNFWQKLTGSFKPEMKKDALEALDRVGILDKAFNRVDQLSGGQQQRVALARTLASHVEVILADEPVASLDPVTARLVLDDLKAINKDLGVTILLNIHHVSLALAYADRVLGIRQGQIVYDGPATGVDSQVLEAIYGQKIELDPQYMD